ncbi:MAG: acetolactate synthase 3 large subunit [Pseudomonadota bacterium]
MELLSGGQMIAKSLECENVEFIFGYPGGAVLHIYDALFNDSDIPHILVRHEQAATHAADAYTRSTGKVGVVLVTSGPGATNAVTGIATAYMDSIPMIVLSGQVMQHLIGGDAFQETDMVGISRPIVKHSFMVKKAEDIPSIMKKAFHIATTGRPGPVVIDIPKDVTDPENKLPFEYPADVNIRSYQVVEGFDTEKVAEAAELIAHAKAPVVYAGGGVIIGNACDKLMDFAQAFNLPVTNTLMGLGSYPATDRQYLGMLGMHGTYEANTAMHNSDLVICVGARFDDRTTNTPSKYCPNAKFIHIDIDPTSISKIITADIGILGQAAPVLEALKEAVEKLSPDTERLEPWWQRLDAWKSAHGLWSAQRYESNGQLIKPQQAIEALYEVTNGEAFVTSDVGQHQMFAAQYYRFDKPRRWINSGGLGTMGFGLPAAMGAKLAHPDADVACVTGEGSIQMNIQELATCTQYKLPVKIINLNNGYLGMVKQWQDMIYSSRYAEVEFAESVPDFVKLAEAYGHVGIRVETLDELKPAMEKAFALKDRVVFLDIVVDPAEHVYPMLMSPNGSMKDMWLSKSEKTS